MAAFLAPVRGPVHPTAWVRPAGNTDFRLTQRYGCTGVAAEPPLGDCAHFHRGIDLGNTRCGAVVQAVAPGKVTYAGLDSTTQAVYVKISHADGWTSSYWHLKDETATLGRRTVVKLGQLVAAGEIIGHVGNTGRSTACHLHFMLRRSGVLKDPWPLIAHL